MKTRYYLILGFVLFIFGFNLVLPIFNRKEGLITESDTFSDKKLRHLGDDIPIPYIVEHFIPPSNSFGLGETNFTSVNWSFFWSKFRANSRWDMEGWHPGLEEWVDEYNGEDLDNWLNITRDRSDDNSSEKITLNFTSPYTTKYRFTFGIDARVLQYVNKTAQFEYELVYPINGTELNYTVFFNWNDLIPMLDNDTIRVNHGIKQIGDRDVFWFRIITNVDLQEGKSYELDPIFGNNVDSGSATEPLHNTGTEYLRGMYLQAPENGVITKIVPNWYMGAGYTYDYECAIYEADGKNDAGNLLKLSETRTINSDTDNWVEFNVSGGYTMTSGTYYHFIVRVKDETATYAYMRYMSSGTSYDGVYKSDSSPVSFDNPLTGESATEEKLRFYVEY